MKTMEEKTSRFREMFSLRMDMAEPEEIRNTILSSSRLQGTNMVILILAIIVASVGLNMNSTAVIIGAMLISPLMGGITCIGYGIATDDVSLAKRAAVQLFIQVFICIVTSTIYFTISPITKASSEILARTSPTVWDVVIAIAGGLAGIVGQTRKEKSNVIPGVAIATALMPPLCTAGYGLATRNLQYFGGALYLFFINGFFICLSAIVVLKYLRLPSEKRLSANAKKRLHRRIAIIAVITMLPSIVFAYQTVRNQIESSNIESFISNEFGFDGTQIVQNNVDTDNRVIEIALLGKKLTDNEILTLNDSLPTYGLSSYKLSITQTEVSGGVTADEVEAMLQNDLGETDDTEISKVVL